MHFLIIHGLYNFMFKGCERVAYCSENCQLLDWRIRGIKCRKGEKNKAKKDKKKRKTKKGKKDEEKEEGDEDSE